MNFLSLHQQHPVSHVKVKRDTVHVQAMAVDTDEGR